MCRFYRLVLQYILGSRPITNRRRSFTACFYIIVTAVAVIYWVTSWAHINVTTTTLQHLQTPPFDGVANTSRLASDDVTELSLIYSSNLVGIIWPKEDTNETTDRIANQIKLMYEYRRTMNESQLARKKVILFVGRINLRHINKGQWLFRNGSCPVNSCYVTRNVSDRRSADVLLISELKLKHRWMYVPKPRNQIWIAHNVESPVHNLINGLAVRGLINWTASYRKDSTIVKPYGLFEKLPNFMPITGVNYAEGRTGKVAWLVSNCRFENNRKGYAKELGEYIDVDVYGHHNCSNKRCPNRKPGQTSDDCMNHISRNYKFYLAFENSFCREYITEKLFENALSNNLLPIVLGAPRMDYEAVAPPGSFVHVDDFQDPQDLAEYLKILDQNDTLYNEYFTWKGTMELIEDRYWCRLCAMLHLRDDVNYVHWYEDYERWWRTGCLAPYQSANSLKQSINNTVTSENKFAVNQTSKNKTSKSKRSRNKSRKG